MLQRTELWQTDKEFVKNSGKERQPRVLSDKWLYVIVRGPEGSRSLRFPEFLYNRQ